MNFIMIGLLLREALDRLCVRLNMYLVILAVKVNNGELASTYCSVHNGTVYLYTY